VVRWWYRKDIREVGSGRTGGTNVLRAAGWKIALMVILVDVLKAAIAVVIARWLDGPPVVLALAGVTAVVGHNYSLFLSFRGGAGTMTAIGGATALWPWSVAILVPLGLGAVLVTRYASVGSIVVALSLPVVFATHAVLGLGPWAYLVHGLLVSALILWSLRSNIRRLLRGEERRVNLGKGRGQ
jgi:glycerol-3-phosphate acyltransferase PlsY